MTTESDDPSIMTVPTIRLTADCRVSGLGLSGGGTARTALANTLRDLAEREVQRVGGTLQSLVDNVSPPTPVTSGDIIRRSDGVRVSEEMWNTAAQREMIGTFTLTPPRTTPDSLLATRLYGTNWGEFQPVTTNSAASGTATTAGATNSSVTRTNLDAAINSFNHSVNATRFWRTNDDVTIDHLPASARLEVPEVLSSLTIEKSGDMYKARMMFKGESRDVSFTSDSIRALMLEAASALIRNKLADDY